MYMMALGGCLPFAANTLLIDSLNAIFESKELSTNTHITKLVT